MLSDLCVPGFLFPYVVTHRRSDKGLLDSRMGYFLQKLWPFSDGLIRDILLWLSSFQVKAPLDYFRDWSPRCFVQGGWY